MLFVRCTITFRVRYVLTGLLALRSYAAPLVVEMARLRICISRVSYLCVLNDSGFDSLFFFRFLTIFMDLHIRLAVWVCLQGRRFSN